MKSRDDFKSDQEYNSYLRAYFAAKAMQAIIGKVHNTHGYQVEGMAKDAVKYADELLKPNKKEQMTTTEILLTVIAFELAFIAGVLMSSKKD